MAVPPPFAAQDLAGPPAKQALRVALRAERIAFAVRATPAMHAAIARNIVGAAAGAADVGAYVAVRGEPDAVAAVSGTGQTIALPRTEPDGIMRFVAWTPDVPLKVGPFGIGEPPPGDEVVPALLLVPLLGFDRAGNRLGQGGGYYDRWLAAHPGVRAIGVGWSVQEVPAIDTDAWDRPLALIATERTIVRP